MKTNIGVFFGGRSTEHEISVISAIQVINSIDTDKYNIIPIYITKEGKWLTGDNLLDFDIYRNPKLLENNCKGVYMKSIYGDNSLYLSAPEGLFRKKTVETTIDIAFPVLHGSNGEDGIFQGLIESIGIPYVGCDVLSSSIGMDKIIMKMILNDCKIPVVPFIWFIDKDWLSHEDDKCIQVEKSLGFPVMVKPANLGSSVGIGKAEDTEELKKRVQEASKYSSRIIIEKMITEMQEINCSVLGDEMDCIASVLEEPIKTGSLLSYEDKYLGGSKGTEGMSASSKRIPAQLSSHLTNEIQELAINTFKVLGCNGVSRVDVMIDKSSGKVYVNEINTIPGSLSYYLWEYTGITFRELTDRLIKLALKRKREQAVKITSYSLNIFNAKGFTSLKGSKGTKLK